MEVIAYDHRDAAWASKVFKTVEWLHNSVNVLNTTELCT